MTIPRRQISELVAQYQLEPSLIDIYVEGVFDKRVLTWFIEESGVKQNIKIITSDAIDVSDGLLKHYSLNLNSNRSKVIAAAKEFFANVPSARILCVVDKDYDKYLQRPNYKEPNLAFTDYNSLDLYWVNEKIWKKIMLLSFGYDQEESCSIFTRLFNIAQNIFLMRLANESLKLELALDGFCKPKYIDIDDLVFDAKKYLKAVLVTAGKMSNYENVLHEMECFRSKLSASHRNDIRGHDFFSLLYYYLKKKALF